MEKTKQVKAYQRKTKSGKTVAVKAYSAKYDGAEDMAKKAILSKKGAGNELMKVKSKKASPTSDTEVGAEEFAKWHDWLLNESSGSKDYYKGEAPKDPGILATHNKIKNKQKSMRKYADSVLESGENADFHYAKGYGIRNITGNDVEKMHRAEKRGQHIKDIDRAVRDAFYGKSNTARQDAAKRIVDYLQEHPKRNDFDKRDFAYLTKLAKKSSLPRVGKESVPGKIKLEKKPSVPKPARNEKTPGESLSLQDFRVWYHDPKSKEGKAVAKKLREQLGSSEYRKLNKQADENYTSRGHIKMFRSVSGGKS